MRQVTDGKVGDRLERRAGGRRWSSRRPCSRCSAIAASLRVDDAVLDYAVRIVRATRTWAGVVAGAGPRGGIALVRAARAAALHRGPRLRHARRREAHGAAGLRHRVTPAPELEIEGRDTDAILKGCSRKSRRRGSDACCPSSRLLLGRAGAGGDRRRRIDLPRVPGRRGPRSRAGLALLALLDLLAGLRMPAPAVVRRVPGSLALGVRSEVALRVAKPARSATAHGPARPPSAERRGRRPAAALYARAAANGASSPTRCGRWRAARRSSGRPSCASFRRSGCGRSAAELDRRARCASIRTSRAGEVHAARHRQPPVADRRAAGAAARRGHGVPPAARVPPGRHAARHRLEGDLAHCSA